MFKRFAQKRREVLKSSSGERNKFEDILGVTVRASIQKGAAQAESSNGSLTIRLNMPVVRKDQVWLDHSH